MRMAIMRWARLFPENSIGWYRKTFTIDRTDSGQRFVLQFDGIFRDSKVWINNCYLGGHFSGYSGSSYDITDFLRLMQRIRGGGAGGCQPV